jgi:hypothetical protein
METGTDTLLGEVRAMRLTARRPALSSALSVRMSMPATTPEATTTWVTATSHWRGLLE